MPKTLDIRITRTENFTFSLDPEVAKEARLASFNFSSVQQPLLGIGKFLLDNMMREDGVIDPKISAMYRQMVNPEAEFRKAVIKQLSEISKKIDFNNNVSMYNSVKTIKDLLEENLKKSKILLEHFNEFIFEKDQVREDYLELMGKKLHALIEENNKEINAAKNHINILGNNCHFWTRSLLWDMYACIAMNLLNVMMLKRIVLIMDANMAIRLRLSCNATPESLWNEQKENIRNLKDCGDLLVNARMSSITPLEYKITATSVDSSFSDYFESVIPQDPFIGSKIDDQKVSWSVVGWGSLLSVVDPFAIAKDQQAAMGRADKISKFYYEHKKAVEDLNNKHITEPLNIAIKALDITMEGYDKSFT